MITPGFKVVASLLAFHFLSLASWRASIVDEDGDGAFKKCGPIP